MTLGREIAEQAGFAAIHDFAWVVLAENHAMFGKGGSDDGLDYLYAAANVYQALVDLWRNGNVWNDPGELADFLDQPIDEWWATDGDLRWFLGDLLTRLNLTDLAARWENHVEAEMEKGWSE